MNVLSPGYALFLAAVFAVHWSLPARWRWACVLAASLAFYHAAAPGALPLLLGATLLAWAAALPMAPRASDSPPHNAFARRLAPLAAALALLAVLVAYKRPSRASVVLPVGLSFYVFQCVSYLLDVRRGTTPPERHPGRFAAFVLFFPKIAAGPIERASHLLPQLATPPAFDAGRASRGMRQIALGLVRKCVVADYFATFTDPLFARPEAFNGMALCFGALLYSAQIYCDFAGYSDIAIGSARLLGFDLADNFRAPCLATSLRDFWSRWHISLSIWFRDYLYIPLGGSRRGSWRTRANLLTTFIVSGLWHGSSATFLMWGALHGLAQIAEKALFPKRRRGAGALPPPGRAAHALGWVATSLFVAVAWVPFRAPTIAAALTYWRRMAGAWRAPITGAAQAIARLAITPDVAARLLLPLIAVMAWDALSLRGDPFERTERLPAAMRWLLHAATVALLLYVLLPQGASSRDFIYYRF